MMHGPINIRTTIKIKNKDAGTSKIWYELYFRGYFNNLFIVDMGYKNWSCYGQAFLPIIRKSFDNFSELLCAREYSQLPPKLHSHQL